MVNNYSNLSNMPSMDSCCFFWLVSIKFIFVWRSRSVWTYSSGESLSLSSSSSGEFDLVPGEGNGLFEGVLACFDSVEVVRGC